MTSTEVFQFLGGYRKTLQGLSLLALLVCAAPPVLYFLDRISLDAMKTWMLVGTFVWFVITPLWMKK